VLIGDIYFRPLRAINEITAHPRWVAQFIILSVVTSIVFLATQPYLVQATLQLLPPSATIEDRQAVTALFQHEGYLRAAFLPFRLLLGLTLCSIVLFYSGEAFSETRKARFAQVFSVVTAAEFIVLFSQIVRLVKIALFGLTGSFSELQMPFSIVGMAHDREDFITESFLHSMNLFSLWYIMFVGLGISVIWEFNRLKAFGISACIWLCSVLMNVALLKLIRENFRFLL
jgi:hypothetical protein